MDVSIYEVRNGYSIINIKTEIATYKQVQKETDKRSIKKLCAKIRKQEKEDRRTIRRIARKKLFQKLKDFFTNSFGVRNGSEII